MKINFACGSKPIPGFFNIDAVHRDGAKIDLIYLADFDENCEIRERIPLDDECAEELHSYHFIEHVYRFHADAMVREWFRLLRPGGRIVLECPNILLAAKNLLAGSRDQLSMWALYGDESHKDPYMCHRFGYTPATLQSLLEANGFTDVQHRDPQTHKARTNRDMRVEARKP